ncbi:MAG TPA: hypothetical protein V6D33_07755 [Cyanophyceae cyanobacterium]
MLPSREEACTLQAKCISHKSKAAYGRLQSAHFKTHATSHNRLADSHRLMGQWYRVKLESASDALCLHYELQVRFHMLRAEYHQERFICCQKMAVEHEKKSEAHEMLFDYLQHKIARRRIKEE